jgi:hypothetical protein
VLRVGGQKRDDQGGDHRPRVAEPPGIL